MQKQDIMKKIFSFLLTFFVGAALMASTPVEKKYLAGAVPEVEGQVVFEKTYEVPGKAASAILPLVQQFVQQELVEGPEHGAQARITELSPDEGVLAASIQETMWFLRKPMRSDFCQFYYQIVCQVKDGSFTVMLRNLRYTYELSDRVEDVATFRAEEWITDKEALSKDGAKLKRLNGKFRRATIDRKDALFHGLGQAAGAKTQSRTIVVEDY